jgi:acetylornithine deacetylase/succinyl-diaminopimelate desuccinylase-like protein
VSQETLEAWYQQHKESLLSDFFAFLRLRSISTDPAFRQETLETAEWVRSYLQTLGLDVELWETTGFPVVFGSYVADPKSPTLLIYHHYDVQPIDPIQEWITPAFEPTLRDDQVYARGAVDNKGQCFYSLCALRAWLELAQQKHLNVKVFIEGEEESGSVGTQEVLARKKRELQADYLLIIDCNIPHENHPAVTVGVRGIATLELTCRNAWVDLHSGLHGGIALNPNRVLVQMLSKLWDEKGRVCVPDFYQGVEQLSEDRLCYVDRRFDEKAYREEFGVGAFCPEEGCSLKESNGLRPTVEINGMAGGYVGEGFKTVIPSKASAKISCRLVPGQDPQSILSALESYLRKLAPEGVELSIKAEVGAAAYWSDLEGALVKTVSLAYEEVFGQSCDYLFCGASIPLVAHLAQVSQAEVALMGTSIDSDALHSPNEHFSLARFELGFLTVGRILERLSSAAQLA